MSRQSNSTVSKKVMIYKIGLGRIAGHVLYPAGYPTIHFLILINKNPFE